MKKYNWIFPIMGMMILFACKGDNNRLPSNIQYVNKFIGTGGNALVTPVASTPFGMVQIGADTYPMATGYKYDHDYLVGFSHVHKSGGGCSDFLDILFMPLRTDSVFSQIDTLYSMEFQSPFRHECEKAVPGYYSVDLYGGNINVELTASLRCGLQRYNYRSKGIRPVIVDLEYGSSHGCTIHETDNYDTVYYSSLQKIDDYSIRGCRLSHGWAPDQQVYFYTRFSSPIKNIYYYLDNKLIDSKVDSISGLNVKAVLCFDEKVSSLDVKTGISAVDMDGAYKNFLSEVDKLKFDEIKENAYNQWSNLLSQIEIETSDTKKKEIFYTLLHYVMMYPMLFSDVDNRFRGPDYNVHKTNGFNYYGAVVGLWDTFRAACPLIAILRPDVIQDYVNTVLEHYKYFGQLPIWTLAGGETFQMIGMHSMPLIVNAYLNGIKDFDIDYAMSAMVSSAMKDTCGYPMRYFVGLKNYKKYGYIPCDLEMESTARTLEYAYDDYAIARFAYLTNYPEYYDYFYNRSMNYKNVIDPESKFARGRLENGAWKEPFNPLRSEHRRDEFCEGNAWQWTFFVPHDVEGLAKHLGGERILESRLDSLFSLSSFIEGHMVSGDISGLLGQYAHGNEPSHHIIYMYNKLGKCHKTQKYINKVLTTLYNNTPDGICGNEDTGQMSAWYVFSSLGLYPMDPVSGQYELGAPLFEKSTIHLPSGKSFVITAENLSDSNIYVKEVYLNGNRLNRSYITFAELLSGGDLHFVMTDNF